MTLQGCRNGEQTSDMLSMGLYVAESLQVRLLYRRFRIGTYMYTQLVRLGDYIIELLGIHTRTATSMPNTLYCKMTLHAAQSLLSGPVKRTIPVLNGLKSR